MFDAFPPPDPEINQEVPPMWPILLTPAPAPPPGDPRSTRRRDVWVAMRDGSWQEAIAWTWSWNDAGRPVRWRVQLEIGGHLRWYWHSSASLRLQRTPG